MLLGYTSLQLIVSTGGTLQSVIRQIRILLVSRNWVHLLVGVKPKELGGCQAKRENQAEEKESQDFTCSK